ncbi:hypothetical protein F5879DRAFT_204002 [Lentinula edodes]|nr:hypothetical protein F5879DRAFT_204002 [Lentinula edodes]
MLYSMYVCTILPVVTSCILSMSIIITPLQSNPKSNPIHRVHIIYLSTYLSICLSRVNKNAQNISDIHTPFGDPMIVRASEQRRSLGSTFRRSALMMMNNSQAKPSTV